MTSSPWAQHTCATAASPARASAWPERRSTSSCRTTRPSSAASRSLQQTGQRRGWLRAFVGRLLGRLCGWLCRWLRRWLRWNNSWASGRQDKREGIVAGEAAGRGVRARCCGPTHSSPPPSTQAPLPPAPTPLCTCSPQASEGMTLRPVNSLRALEPGTVSLSMTGDEVAISLAKALTLDTTGYQVRGEGGDG